MTSFPLPPDGSEFYQKSILNDHVRALVQDSSDFINKYRIRHPKVSGSYSIPKPSIPTPLFRSFGIPGFSWPMFVLPRLPIPDLNPGISENFTENLKKTLHQFPEEFGDSNDFQLLANLQECTDEIKIRDIREFIEQEGIPLYAIPRDRDIVLKLLEAKDRQGRRQILGEFCQSLVADCAAILEQARNTIINDLRGFIEDGIVTIHAGHYYAAQALFTVILDTLISYFYPDQENRRKIIGHQRSASVPDEIKAMEIRDALVWLPIWHAHEQFWASRGDSVPNDRYSRHASVHAVSVDQYNKENCIQVMMLVASLIAYAEQIDS